MATFSAIVIRVRGHYKNINNKDFVKSLLQMIMRKNITILLDFCEFFHNEYTKINNAFNIGEDILVMLKNITTRFKYDRFFKTNVFIILTPMIIEEIFFINILLKNR